MGWDGMGWDGMDGWMDGWMDSFTTEKEQKSSLILFVTVKFRLLLWENMSS